MIKINISFCSVISVIVDFLLKTCHPVFCSANVFIFCYNLWVMMCLSSSVHTSHISWNLKIIFFLLAANLTSLIHRLVWCGLSSTCCSGPSCWSSLCTLSLWCVALAWPSCLLVSLSISWACTGKTNPSVLIHLLVSGMKFTDMWGLTMTSLLYIRSD